VGINDVFAAQDNMNLTTRLVNPELLSLSTNAEAMNTRGLEHLSAGRYELAESAFKSVIAFDKTFVAAWGNLVNCLREIGKSNEAIDTAQSGISQGIENADLYNNYGSALFGLGQFELALNTFKKAVALSPSHFVAQLNIIKSFFCLNQSFNAVDYAGKILLPDKIEIPLLQAFLGVTYQNGNDSLFAICTHKLLRDMENSQLVELFDQPEEINKSFVAADYFKVTGDIDCANDIYQKLLTLASENVAIVNNYGSFLFSIHRYEEAKEQFLKVVSLNDKICLSYRNLGVCHAMLKERESALAAYEKAYALDPLDQPSLVLSLDMKLHLARWEQFYEGCDALALLMKRPLTDMCGSLQLLPLTESAQTQYEYLRKTSSSFFANLPKITLNRVSRKTTSKIRVGYLSFDFRDHPVSYLTAELYGLHDRERFEVYVYSYGPADNAGGYRERIIAGCDVFVDLEASSMPEMARRIYEDDIDVLIDLTGNTQHTRSAIMAYRLAPVQAHWLGYVATMGSEHYDYIFSDPITSPKGYDEFFVEKLVRLPYTFQINDRQRPISNRIFQRAELGLPVNGFVFCNFTQVFKIQPKMFACWMRILLRVPGSVMWLAVPANPTRDALKAQASKLGVDPIRLIFAEKIPFSEHLARYRCADLLLDTAPIGSGTSASDCLWAGCPLLVCAGELMYSRMAAGIAHAAQQDDLIATSIEQFEEIAVEMATHPSRLRKLRESLVNNRDKLPLFDTPDFVKHFEQALTAMHVAVNSKSGPCPVSIQHERVHHE
jgi:protein O-GlcNAc transferase